MAKLRSLVNVDELETCPLSMSVQKVVVVHLGRNVKVYDMFVVTCPSLIAGERTEIERLEHAGKLRH